jgi:hypothetical protein
MTDPWLSPELDEIQRALAAGPRDDPPSRLRARIIGRVQAELRGKKSALHRYPLAAAAALVWLNLALSATNATWQPLDVPAPRAVVEPLARQIGELLPELSRGDARRLAVLYWAGSRVVPCPDVPSGRAPDRRVWGEEI